MRVNASNDRIIGKLLFQTLFTRIFFFKATFCLHVVLRLQLFFYRYVHFHDLSKIVYCISKQMSSIPVPYICEKNIWQDFLLPVSTHAQRLDCNSVSFHMFIMQISRNIRKIILTRQSKTKETIYFYFVYCSRLNIYYRSVLFISFPQFNTRIFICFKQSCEPIYFKFFINFI